MLGRPRHPTPKDTCIVSTPPGNPRTASVSGDAPVSRLARCPCVLRCNLYAPTAMVSTSQNLPILFRELAEERKCEIILSNLPQKALDLDDFRTHYTNILGRSAVVHAYMLHRKWCFVQFLTPELASKALELPRPPIGLKEILVKPNRPPQVLCVPHVQPTGMHCLRFVFERTLPQVRDHPSSAHAAA